MIRRALPADDQPLAAIDHATWSSRITPQVRWPADRRFLDRDLDPDNVLVAEVDGAVVGYVKLGSPTPLAANRHVLEVQGLAVAPGWQRRGIASRLLVAAIDEARRRGIRRLTLRVLATNPAARKLYDSLGFEGEGVLREEFLIDGEYVDDVLMAIRIGRDRRATNAPSGRPEPR